MTTSPQVSKEIQELFERLKQPLTGDELQALVQSVLSGEGWTAELRFRLLKTLEKMAEDRDEAEGTLRSLCQLYEGKKLPKTAVQKAAKHFSKLNLREARSHVRHQQGT